MRNQTKKSSPSETPVADEATLEKEYELAKPIIQGGMQVDPPTKVILNDQQAERLRKTGHIV